MQPCLEPTQTNQRLTFPKQSTSYQSLCRTYTKSSRFPFLILREPFDVPPYLGRNAAETRPQIAKPLGFELFARAIVGFDSHVDLCARRVRRSLQ